MKEAKKQMRRKPETGKIRNSEDQKQAEGSIRYG